MKKTMSLVMLLAALLAFGGAASAQMPVFCGDLPQADCQILESAQTAAMTMTSARAAFEAQLTVANIPDTPFKSLAFSLEGSGQYAIDAALMEKYAGLETDPAALLSDMSQFGPLVADLLTGFSGQLNLTLTLPSELLETLPSEGVQIPPKLSVELRMVDGVSYVNLSALAEAMPTAGIPGGWYGLELAKLLQNVFEMFAGSLDGAELPGFDPSALTQFSDPELIGEFMTLKRLPDAQVDGQAVAVFEGALDYTRLASSEVFKGLMRQQMEAMGETLSDAELNQMLDLVGQMYQGLTFTFTQAVDLDEFYPRQTTLDFQWDLAQMMAAIGEDSEAAPVIGLKLTSMLSDFNQPMAIKPPAGAAVLAAEDAIQMFMSGMQGSF